MRIQLLRSDISSLMVDAIAAASDTHAHAHDGRAVVQTGGNLLARFVIHVPVPHADTLDADEKLQSATREVLERAEELAVGAVGLPPLGTAAQGYTTERCARAMIPVAIEHRDHARSLQRVVFCLFGPEEHAVFDKVLRELEA
jgi:O-acetyl-ADP-ribose deacetylase (regulator of RNase III)